jgi:deoxyribonuclease (pyrimidine dimer)
MTRINSSIQPQNLTDEHLCAEYREIIRICNNYKIRIGKMNNLPKSFTLGKGHVLFFVDKPNFTLERYKQLHNECLSRGFNVKDYSENWNVFEKRMFNNIHTPTLHEKELLIERISLRLLNSKKPYWHYRNSRITKQEAVNLLKKTM